ncbi:hypothetical protein P8452_23944 [Trifolium repens]|nr:pumilio [Trifolium repens]WJX36024.1 hypothetical protein P8452_23944 [Trifolium repens]
MEEQLRSLQLPQPSNITHVQRHNPSDYQYGLINNAPTMEEINSALGGLCVNNRNTSSIGHGYGGLPRNEDYRVRERAFLEARAAPRMHGHVFPPPSWRGNVLSWAMDRSKCKDLQAVIEDGNPIYVQLILSEVKDYLHLLMMHPFGNFLIQKIFQARRGITLDQVNFIIKSIISDEQQLKQVCMNSHGTRVVQIMLENIICPYTKYAFVYIMKRMTVALMKNANGNYVIEKCVKVFPPELQIMILNEIAINCVDIATDKIGTSAIQKCLRYGNRIAIALLVTEISSNAMILAEDPYGNYVLQIVIKMKFPSAHERMIKELRGKFVRLSVNMYASNVVEDLLRVSNQNDVRVIVEELMTSRNFLDVLQDRFGNYVAQRALQYTQGRLCRQLSNLINSYHKDLHSHIYGKNVLTMAKTYIEGKRINI